MSTRHFFARDGALAKLSDHLERVLHGQGQICFVIGETGSGKTTLVEEFITRSQETNDDLQFACGHCTPQGKDVNSYQPFKELFAELVEGDSQTPPGVLSTQNRNRLRRTGAALGDTILEVAPDLIGTLVPGSQLAARAVTHVAKKLGLLEKLSQPEGASEAEKLAKAQAEFLGQYASALKVAAKHQPLLLFVDDLQWADPSSLALLFHLCRNIAEDRILLIGAYRTDQPVEVMKGDVLSLPTLMAEIRRLLGDVDIDLDRTRLDESRPFVDAVLDATPNRYSDPFRRAFFKHTAGQPLFTVELLNHLRDTGQVRQDQEGYWVEQPDIDWSSLPTRIMGVIERRLENLDLRNRQMLAAASVEGQQFTAEVLARTTQRGLRDVLGDLSQDLEQRRHLVRRLGVNRASEELVSQHEFIHRLLQEYVYGQLDERQRQLMHAEVAAALEDIYKGNTESIAGELAHHYAEAHDARKASHYLLLAGDQSRALYDFAQAVKSYERAHQFLQRMPGEGALTARLLMKLGLTYQLTLDFKRARQAYEDGFALWRRVSRTRADQVLPVAARPLRVDWRYEPLTLDPALASDVDTSGIVEQLFRGLAQLNADMDVLPDLALRWDISDDGQKYVFHLDPKARWSDGTPVTAHDVEYAWKRLLSPALASPVAELLLDIKGAGAYHADEEGSSAHLGVRALDDLTLSVELEQPVPYFLQLLANAASFPVPRHVVENHGQGWADPARVVTSGPFVLGERERGARIVLARSDQYSGQFTGNVGRVEALVMADGDRLDAYDRGELDVLSLGRDTEKLQFILQTNADEYLSAPWLATSYIGVCVTQPPFDRRQVRLAFASAIDKERFAERTMRGYVFSASGGLIPPGMPGHSPGIGLGYDPGMARTLLANAGGVEAISTPIVLATGEGSEETARFLVDQWHENLGVEVTWQPMSYDDLHEALEHQPPHLFLDTWYADYPDPDNFLRVCPGARWSRFDGASISADVTGARFMADPEKRMDTYRRIDNVLIQDAALIPLVYWRTHLLVKAHLRQFPVSAVKWWHFKDVVIRDE